MRILIATDAWHPQVNGVVRTLTKMAEAAADIGVEIQFLTPQSFRTISLPSYADIQLALPWPGKVARMIEAQVFEHGTAIEQANFGCDTLGAAEVFGEPLVGFRGELFVDVEAVEGPVDDGLFVEHVA